MISTNKMTSTEQLIYNYIEKNGDVRPFDIIREVSLSQQMVQRILKKLLGENIITKKGSPPRVFYSTISLNTIHIKSERTEYYKLSENNKKIIEDNFYTITPDGKEYYGFVGFHYWCNVRDFDINKYAQMYIDKIKDAHKLCNRDGYINATQKITNSFGVDSKNLDELWYGSFYSLPIFGKTKLAQKLFQAKQTQNIRLIEEVILVAESIIYNFIRTHEPDAIAFVPPTAIRRIQFMKELERTIVGIKPIVKIEKISTDIMIQQKTLKDINERIINAENTMIVHNSPIKYKKILIIDDFTGSGSTLNILAKKIKKQNIADYVIGLTVTGSMNGFEVIREI